MTLYARSVSGIVVETFTPPDGVVIADCFTPDLVAQFVAVPSGQAVVAGWTFDGTNFAAPTPPPPPSLAQQAVAMLAAGCQITSTGTPALNATYPCDPTTQADIQAELISLMLNNTFTNGTTTLLWLDATNTPRAFSVAAFKAFATAVGTFVGALKIIAATNSGTLPSATLPPIP